MNYHKKILLSLSVLALSSVLYSSEKKIETVSEYNTPTAKNLTEFVMSNNGYVDKKLHAYFWSLINKKQQTKDTDQLKLMLLDTPRLQVMIWRSIKNSIEQHKIIYVAGLMEELSLLKYVPGIMDHTKQMIQCAANDTPYSFGDEKKFVFTLSMANQFLDDWKTAGERSAALFDRSFDFKPYTHKLTHDMSFNWYFTPSVQDMNVSYANNTYPSNGFSSRVNESEYFFISESKNTIKDIKKNGLKSCVQDFFKIIGNNEKIDVRLGKNTAFGMSKNGIDIDGSSYKVFTAIGCELINKKVYVFLTNSSSKIKSAKLFAKISSNVHVKKEKK